MASRAYFDDSGTHGGSDFVVWGGFVGVGFQWDFAEPAWTAVLESRGLAEFHMAECAGSEIAGPYGNFAERASLIHDLRKTILEAALYGVVVGVDLVAWRDLMSDDPASEVLTPEGICIAHCLLLGAGYAQAKDVDPKGLAYFLDAGAASSPKAAPMVAALNRMSGRSDSVGLLPVSNSPALQMADMLVWEARRDGIAYSKEGPSREPRTHFKRFLDRKHMVGGLMGRPEIERIAARDPTMGSYSELFEILGA